MKRNGKLAILLALALSMTSVTPAVAEESFSVNAKDDSSVVLSTAEALSEEVDTLSRLEPDVDYVKDEGVIEAESEEEAEKIATAYGAKLTSFDNGIGLLKFEGVDIKDAIECQISSVSVDTPVMANYIFTLNDETNYVQAEGTATDFKYEPGAGINKTEDESSSNDTVAEEAASEEVSIAKTVNDTYYSEQWAMDAINVESAWDKATGSGVKVAIIDTGIDYGHPDLKNQIGGTYSVYTKSTSLSDADDTQGHGTHVAGIIAAEANNSEGVAGVAYDATLYPIKVFQGRETSLDKILAGLAYITEGDGKDWGIDVVNMSLGTQKGTDISQESIDAFQKQIDALRNMGITVIVAAGNDGVSEKSYPAACNHVLSIAASTVSGQLADFSNYGDWVNFAAPGEGILSTYCTSTKRGYAELDGTSMACPVVVGVAALAYESHNLVSKNSASTPDAVMNMLKASTDGKTYSYGGHSVTGCIDALKAVNAVYSEPGDDPSPSPVTPSGNNGTPSQNNAPFCIVAKSGMVTTGTTIPIGAGAKTKFYIGDKSGKKIKEANKKGATTWTVSGAGFAVKNGKLEVSSAATGTGVLTATYGGYSESIVMVVIPKTKYFGYIAGNKFHSKCSIQTCVGQTISLNSLKSINNNTDVYYYYKRTCSRGFFSRTYTYYATGPADNIGFCTKAAKKAEKNGVLTYNKDGSVLSFTPAKKGTYKFTYVSLDGSNKKFTVSVKVK